MKALLSEEITPVHHAKHFPASYPHRNYGITLIVRDFIFRTIYWPSDDENLPIGLDDRKTFLRIYRADRAALSKYF